MTDSLEQFSKPSKIEKTKCATLFWFNPSRSRKGREFVPLYDERFPFVEDFYCKYLYYSKFLERDNAAGNHYHEIKQEILIPLHGRFEAHLENVDTGEKEVIMLDPSDDICLYVPVRISHKIISREDSGVLLVVASAPSALDDEIAYEVS